MVTLICESGYHGLGPHQETGSQQTPGTGLSLPLRQWDYMPAITLSILNKKEQGFWARMFVLMLASQTLG